jgi:hypothetical protein
MRNLLQSLLILLIFLPACGANTATRIKAAYLVVPGGQLASAELNQHPEIFVTSSFSAFQKAARRRIALWIDKDALSLVDSAWLDQLPQSSYPIIVVGYNDPLRSFRDGLTLCCFAGPVNPDYSGSEPGFSVIERASGAPSAPVTWLQGFKQAPHVVDILQVSNALLEGKLLPTATLPSPDVSTPSMP